MPQYTVFGGKNGYTSNYIIFGKKDLQSDADGYADGTDLKDASYVNYDSENDSDYGTWNRHLGNMYYWTSTMSSNPSQARGVKIKTIGNYDRKLGFHIRPVRDK